MTCVFIVWGNSYSGFNDVVRCAIARSGCPVLVVMNPPRNQKLSVGLDRWMVLYDLVREGKVSLPVMSVDWDMMIFSDLNFALEPFEDFDYGVTLDKDGNASAAYFINSFTPLRQFAEAESTPRSENDMMAWHYIKGKRAILSEPVNGGVFDHNMGCPGRAPYGNFQLDSDGLKKITWVNNIPHFVRPDGYESLVRAHVLHCWGAAKTRTHEFLEKAGIA